MSEERAAIINPTSLNVLVEAMDDREEKSEGGIILPLTSQRGHLKVGKVVAAGPGAFQFGQWIENPIKAGDVIVYDPRGGHDFMHQRRTMQFIENQMIKSKVE